MIAHFDPLYVLYQQELDAEAAELAEHKYEQELLSILLRQLNRIYVDRYFKSLVADELT